MNIVMLGAPGAGKGTLSDRMTERYNIPHISTGDIFRYNIKNGTELGNLAKSYIDKGALVPDDVTTNMILDRLKDDDCKNGYILDGFPRNINQAEALKNVDICILVDAPFDMIEKRLVGRRVCENCGDTYHIETLKPKVDGICDKCKGKLIQRKDDTSEVIRDRLKTYKEQTEPLIDYYKNKGILKIVNGFDKIENSLKNIDGFLG